MASLTLILAVLSALLPTSIATDEPKVVALKMARYVTPANVLQRRDSTGLVSLSNLISAGLYYVNASVGTPPQTVSLQVDTGSSDVWMFAPNSCDTTSSPCLGGTFDSSKSSTFSELSSNTFSIQYQTPGSGVQGDYISDAFGVGSLQLSNLTMALAKNASSVPTGIMGIGFDSDESITEQGGLYPNFIDLLVQQNLIKSRSYSLWLDDLSSSTGSILFGGYDSDKFTGQLTTLNIQPDATSGNITSMTVAWTSLALNDPTNGISTITPDGFAAPAVLDSGTTLTILPSVIADAVLSLAGAVPSEQYGPLVPCNLSSYTGTLDYTFGGQGGPKISVGFNELVLPITDDNGNPLTFDDGSSACNLGIQAAGEGEQLLFGDTFLRSAYVVYDLDAKQIAIAPTNFKSTSSSVHEIDSSGSSSGGIDGATNAPTAVTARQTATRIAPAGFFGSATNSAIATAPGHAGFLGTAATTGVSPSATKGAAATVTPLERGPIVVLLLTMGIAMAAAGGSLMAWL